MKIISDNPKPNNPNIKGWLTAHLDRSTAEIAIIIKMVTTLSEINKYCCSKEARKREYYRLKTA
jgi:hypothetical protein